MPENVKANWDLVFRDTFCCDSRLFIVLQIKPVYTQLNSTYISSDSGFLGEMHSKYSTYFSCGLDSQEMQKVWCMCNKSELGESFVLSKVISLTVIQCRSFSYWNWIHSNQMPGNWTKTSCYQIECIPKICIYTTTKNKLINITRLILV